MKKITVLLTISICIILSGCSDSNTGNQQQGMNSNSVTKPNTLSNENVKTLKSDDFKTIVNVYTSQDYNAPKIEKIVVSNGADTFVVSDVVGYYDNMQWVPGKPKAVIEYYGRTWRNFLIIDTEKKEVLYKEPFSFQELMDSFEKYGASFNYKLSKNRPDVEFKFSKMIDDNNIMINYKAHDENYTIIQSGSFVYNISKGTFSELKQNKPMSEG